jgi:NAD(P)H-hydrate epimerase
MAGAGIVAARTALRAGAGYVRLITDPGNRDIVQSALPEAVFVDGSDHEAVREAVEASRAVAVGPGMGLDDRARSLLRLVLSTDVPRVVDADALTLLAESGEIADLGQRTVLTPHPGEAARLLGASVEEVQRDRPLSARRLRDRTGAEAVVLKGSPTLIQGPDGLAIDTVGTSDLAVAGMGDTLTGAVGAFLAQGCPVAESAALGLLATGRAAALADRGSGLQAADVPDFVPDALSEEEARPGIPIPGLILDLDPPR